MKKRILAIFLVSLFLFNYAYSDSCKYTSKIEKCNDALKDYLNRDTGSITPGGSLRNFDDFVCLQDSAERRVYQIIMEENFKKIDVEMENYLVGLETSKDLCFSSDSELTYMDCLNGIWENGEKFKNLYHEACKTTLNETKDCAGDPMYLISGEKGTISVLESIEFLGGGNGDCYQLADLKVGIFRTVAYNTLIMNKQAMIKDEKKLYDQQVRTKYDNVLDLLMINLGYAERIRKKWPYKIKHVLGN